jgi:hypothetical protein
VAHLNPMMILWEKEFSNNSKENETFHSKLKREMEIEND